MNKVLLRGLALSLAAALVINNPAMTVRADDKKATEKEATVTGQEAEKEAGEEAIEEAEIALNKTKKTIYTGKTFKLVLNGITQKVSWWKSTDESVATVKGGKVTAVAAGTCDVKVRYNKKTYTCKITVKDPYIKPDRDYMRVGDTMKMTVKGDKALEYKSSKPKIISVEEDGTLTAHKKGTAKITATCKSGRTLEITINVYDQIKIIENPTFDDLAPTTHMTFAELVGNRGEVGYPKAMPAPDTYRITVDLYWKVIMVYARDNNGEYTIPIRYMLCSPGKSTSQTPTGTFEMKGTRVRNSRFNGLTVWAQFWSLITGRIYFHSILYNSSNASDYTASYSRLGNAASHGCIRLTVPDARWIYYNAAPGTVVEIRSGSSKDSATKAIKNKLKLAAMPSVRPTLKAKDIPWTDNWEIDEVPQDFKYVRVPQ